MAVPVLHTSERLWKQQTLQLEQCSSWRVEPDKAPITTARINFFDASRV